MTDKQQPITFSHSKINLLLEDPYSYFLNYLYKVKPIKKSNALQIGEAVHYGIEHSNADLSDFFKANGSLEQQNGYSHEQILSESLVSVFLDYKDNIINDILGDAKIIETFNEFKIEVQASQSIHQFLGIIDLLIKTDKGWIIVDYKTTSKSPNYDDYLEQLYRYCYLIQRHFNEPVYKIAIIALRKASIKQRMNENGEQFKHRLMLEYKEKAQDYLTYKVFDSATDTAIFNPDVLNEYYDNLEHLISYCGDLTLTERFPLNYSKAIGVYGQSQYYDFIYWNEDNIKSNYYIKDIAYDELSETIKEERTITDFDLKMIKLRQNNSLNLAIIQYEQFLNAINFDIQNYNEEVLLANYLTSPELLRLYKKTFEVLETMELNNE